MSLIAQLAEVMGAGESVTFKVEAKKEGALRVAVIPTLPNAPEGMSADAERVRSALAQPFLVSGSAVEVETALAERLGQYAAARGEVRSAFDGLMEALREAKKAATGATQTAQTTKTKADATPEPAKKASQAGGAQSGATKAASSVKKPESAGDPDLFDLLAQ